MPNKLTDSEHRKLLKKMGITDEQDKEWHRQHGDIDADASVNPFQIGGGFLKYCVEQKWLTTQGEGKKIKYYVTEEGKKQLRNFGIEV